MAFKLNPHTGKHDATLGDLDQIPIGDADTYFKFVAPDTLQLWVNGVVRQSWTTAVVSSITTGSPVPLGYLLTYP
jgi:hypothetical protein